VHGDAWEILDKSSQRHMCITTKPATPHAQLYFPELHNVPDIKARLRNEWYFYL
jgi:hypothetical protein